MATTPIYNWSIPDNTDLVKNGALAIRTLGDAIDTTMATMVPKTIVDAKGDLIAGTAADTTSRLAVGNNGETLVADSSQAVGLAWAGNYAAGKNKIINGAFDVWQRGSSFTLANNTPTYCADRFRVTSAFSAGSTSVSRQTFTPATAPVAGYEGQFFQRITAATTTTYIDCFQLIEDVRTFAGQSVTFSFWAKASASVTVNGYRIQNFGSGGSSEVAGVQGTFGLTTSWQRFTTTFTVPSISGKTVGTSSYLAIGFYISSGITAGLTIDTWGVQLEAGSVATAFQTATGTIQGELAACKYYYQRWTGASANYLVNGYGPAYSTTAVAASLFNLQPMRVKPTAVDYSSLKVEDNVNAGVAITGLSISTSSSSQQVTLLATGATGLTQYRYYQIISNGSGDYIGVSAEL